MKKDERLRQTEEQLRKSEEDRQFVKSMLRQMEEEKLRAEEEKRIADERERERLAEEERIRAEEAEKKRQMQAKPAMTIEEMFAKLDAESEYNRNSGETQVYYAPENAEPIEHTYVNAYSSHPVEQSHSQSTLKDIFKQLDEREAQIDAQNKQDEPEHEPVREEYAPAAPQNVEQVQPVQTAQPVQNQNTYAAREYMPAEIEGANQNYSAPADKGQFVTSAVVNRQEGGFKYEKDDVNYREFFVSLSDNNQKSKKKSNRNKSIFRTATSRRDCMPKDSKSAHTTAEIQANTTLSTSYSPIASTVTPSLSFLRFSLQKSQLCGHRSAQNKLCVLPAHSVGRQRTLPCSHRRVSHKSDAKKEGEFQL